MKFTNCSSIKRTLEGAVNVKTCSTLLYVMSIARYMEVLVADPNGLVVKGNKKYTTFDIVASQYPRYICYCFSIIMCTYAMRLLLLENVYYNHC